MWVAIVGDGDIDYTEVYGPFDSVEEANAAVAGYEDTDDISIRVESIRSPQALIERMAEEDDDYPE